MPDQVDVIVGRRLRHRRRLLGMTQQELAALCGVSFQQVQKYECAYNRMSVAMLWKLACALGVSVEYFFPDIPKVSRADKPARRSAEKPAAHATLSHSQAA